jgi:hypothetical protein
MSPGQRLLRFCGIGCFALVLRACAEGEGVEPISDRDSGLVTDGAAGGGGNGGDASADAKAGSSGTGGSSAAGGAGGGDASNDDGTSDAPSTDATDATDSPPPNDSGGMDPGLSLPVASGQPCYVFGSPGECPSAQVCRLFSPTEGRCEACTAPCGALGAACTASAGCDVQFQCYLGACTNFCRIGQKCGATADCVNVGHASTGMCPP